MLIEGRPRMESPVVTEEQVRAALRNVLDPEIGKPIEDIGMLKGIEVDGGNVRVFVLLTIAGCPLKDRINSDVTAAVSPIEGVESVDVILGEMSGEQREGLVQQFLGDVYWGDLDFLLVDLPPGTGDVSLSLASFLPGSSMLVVTTPQDAARKVAERAGRMAQHPNVRMKILGVIENMAGFACPHCGEITDVFGRGGGEETAKALDADFLGSVPMQVSLREGSDSGTPIVVRDPDSPAGSAFRDIARQLARKS